MSHRSILKTFYPRMRRLSMPSAAKRALSPFVARGLAELVRLRRGKIKSSMPVQVIINADDFGASADVNAAVREARRNGVLTSASLMVTGKSVKAAVDIARQDPGLAVGLHLTLSNGSSLLPPAQIPMLVDADRRFRDSPARAALNYYISGLARPQLRLEVEAQFRAFARTGLRMSHVDGHQHLHLHPVVLPMVLELATCYGASGIRVPCEPWGPSTSIDRFGFWRRAVVAGGHAYLRSSCRHQLAHVDLARCEVAIGSLMSGRMSVPYTTAMLKMLHCHSIEIFFHPSTTDSGNRCGPNRGDLDALLDPVLRRFLDEHDFELTNYSGLREKVKTCGRL